MTTRFTDHFIAPAVVASRPAASATSQGALFYATDDKKIYKSDGVSSWSTFADLSAGSGHTIQDEGTPLTARAALNFVGAGVVATDDAGNNATVVTISASAAANNLFNFLTAR